mmetsp:Transcript_108304/g.231241  ORF Transcript_108304/g.231241 Transcript_108304/m.231241 type:complete len:481 (+) Transcript_108304:392-1834(+)
MEAQAAERGSTLQHVANADCAQGLLRFEGVGQSFEALGVGYLVPKGTWGEVGLLRDDHQAFGWCHHCTRTGTGPKAQEHPCQGRLATAIGARDEKGIPPLDLEGEALSKADAPGRDEVEALHGQAVTIGSPRQLVLRLGGQGDGLTQFQQACGAPVHLRQLGREGCESLHADKTHRDGPVVEVVLHRRGWRGSADGGVAPSEVEGDHTVEPNGQVVIDEEELCEEVVSELLAHGAEAVRTEALEVLLHPQALGLAAAREGHGLRDVAHTRLGHLKAVLELTVRRCDGLEVRHPVFANDAMRYVKTDQHHCRHGAPTTQKQWQEIEHLDHLATRGLEMALHFVQEDLCFADPLHRILNFVLTWRLHALKCRSRQQVLMQGGDYILPQFYHHLSGKVLQTAVQKGKPRRICDIDQELCPQACRIIAHGEPHRSTNCSIHLPCCLWPDNNTREEEGETSACGAIHKFDLQGRSNASSHRWPTL